MSHAASLSADRNDVATSPALVDPSMPSLTAALDPVRAARAIERAGVFGSASVDVAAARLVRHKLGKRCLLDYELVITDGTRTRQHLAVIGKIRAGHRPRTAYRRLEAFWRAGFHADAPDGVCVPEPLGVVPELDMWLQRRELGDVATAVVSTSRGPQLVMKVAHAIRKIHAAEVPTRRVHTMEAELGILERGFASLTMRRPDLSARLRRLLGTCQRIAPDVSTACIHRDFYADQLIVAGERLVVVDFDLYCTGPAAIDAGNFIGHLEEQAIREPDRREELWATAHAFRCAIEAVEGERTPDRAIRACTALTMARHVYLSTTVPGRSGTTMAVLTRAEALAESI